MRIWTIGDAHIVDVDGDAALAIVDAAASRGEASAARTGRSEILDGDAAFVERYARIEIDETHAGELVLEAAIDNLEVAIPGKIAGAKLDLAFAVQRAGKRLVRQARRRPQGIRRPAYRPARPPAPFPRQRNPQRRCARLDRRISFEMGDEPAFGCCVDCRSEPPRSQIAD